MTSDLLARLDASPFLRIEHRGPYALLCCPPTGRTIGSVDERTGLLTVDVDREFVGPLLDRHPQLGVTAGGVRLDAAAPAADAIVRWRIDLELFAPQLGAASP